jgi:putative sugar O-methyltransferase
MTYTSSISENNLYNKFCLEAANDSSIFKNFKVNSVYNAILEHVTPYTGNEYYEVVKKYYSDSIDLIDKIKINDLYGSPQIFDYYFGSFSPTTLRYLKVAAELKHCFNNIQNLNILEIGGGYGGQALISKVIHNFNSWTIVDLPEVVKLQQTYLKHFDSSNIESISYLDKYDTKKYDLVVSNYAFSECIRDVQLNYIEKVMSNNEKIYMTLNFIQTEDVRFNNMLSLEELTKTLNVKVYEEKPSTHPTNVIVLKNNDKEPYST